MMDFLDEALAAASGPLSVEVTINGQKGSVFLRRLTAGERQAILKGQKVSRVGDGTHFELDLELNEEQRQRTVLYAVVTSDGKQRFKGIAEVKALPAHVVDVLYGAFKSLDDNDMGNG